MARKKPTNGAFKAEALLIDTNPTAYNTRFRLNALQQVTDTINEQGLPVLVAHDSSKLPVGAWYEARVEDQTVITKFYVPKEVREYDDIKTRIEAEILDAVSIGFRAGIHDCSICGSDIQDYENCSHVPGQEYDIKDPIDGTPLGKNTCYVMLDDIKASEASLVYSGAVPQAKIIDSSSKEEFFTVNHMNFAEGQLEVVHSGKFVQDNTENKNKTKELVMDEYKELQTKHQELKDKFSDTREDLVTVKEKNLEFKEKAEGFDKAVEDKTTAEANYSGLLQEFSAKVEALAIPFDADYKAPDNFEDLSKDFDKYMEETKKLPSGQQTLDESVSEYSEPDESYKV